MKPQPLISNKKIIVSKTKTKQTTTKNIPTLHEKEEYLEMIEYLKKQINNKYEENKDLLSQLHDYPNNVGLTLKYKTEIIKKENEINNLNNTIEQLAKELKHKESETTILDDKIKVIFSKKLTKAFKKKLT